MEGFAEKGTPADWDLALGTVRGFRSWTMRLPLRSASEMGQGLRGGSALYGWGRNMDHYAPVLPILDQSHVEGMYGGPWKYTRQREGWYHASCTGANSRHRRHRPPEPDCGCGFWAYWNTSDDLHFGTQLPWVKKYNYRGYEVLIPLSGTIDGSGPTIIGDRGFRTGRARITDLSMPVTGHCVYEEESQLIPTTFTDPALPAVLSPVISSYSYMSSHVRDVDSLLSFLSRELAVPEDLVQETVYAAVALSLGGNFRWHASARELIAACPPDENYGR